MATSDANPGEGERGVSQDGAHAVMAPDETGAQDMVFREMSFYYGYGTKNPVKALDRINLTIHEHEYIGLIGHTGSGKSTLVQHMNGLNIPQEGTLTVGDITTTAPKADLRRLRQQVGLVFQYPEDQLFEETIYKDIAFGPKNLKLSDEEIDERVRWAMASVGLDYETKKDKSPFEISGGQKRRVAIAGVLALRPRYLVLDEPTAGLDPQGRNEILATIRRLYEENPELTIVLVTHSMEDIAEQANRILVVDAGRVVMDGTPHEIFHRRAELEDMGLSVPQVTALMQDLKEDGLPVEDTAITVDEAVDALDRYLAKHAGEEA
ncbi:MAG: energy-coupling factor transporter ATPase [Peptoniphilaceae bacterium]|nr:energy-coupling factor transporter ATPase [Peptoniphilaceae bacterium]